MKAAEAASWRKRSVSRRAVAKNMACVSLSENKAAKQRRHRHEK